MYWSKSDLTPIYPFVLVKRTFAGIAICNTNWFNLRENTLQSLYFPNINRILSTSKDDEINVVDSNNTIRAFKIFKELRS